MADQNCAHSACDCEVEEGKESQKTVSSSAVTIVQMSGHRGRTPVSAVMRIASS
jgi:hypothetical protein